MENILTGPLLQLVLNRKMLTALGLLLGGILTGLAFVFWTVSAVYPPVVAPLTIAELEARYGLRVNLAALTAAGGMVDVRLKMVDGHKASLLLQDKNNFPVVVVEGSKIKLSASEETLSQQLKFEDNGGLFLIYPNSGNAVKPGSSIRIVFGDIQLESIPVR
jgi:hypothetical protein